MIENDKNVRVFDVLIKLREKSLASQNLGRQLCHPLIKTEGEQFHPT